MQHLQKTRGRVPVKVNQISDKEIWPGSIARNDLSRPCQEGTCLLFPSHEGTLSEASIATEESRFSLPPYVHTSLPPYFCLSCATLSAPIGGATHADTRGRLETAVRVHRFGELAQTHACRRSVCA